MNLYVHKSPNPQTRAIKVYALEAPGPEFVQMTEDSFTAWLDSQPSPPIPEPPPPAPNYLTFWDAVLISQTYAQLLGYSMTSLPTNTALTAFIAAFQDAKEGRPNTGAIQACIFLVMGAAQEVLTAEHLAELQALMDAHHLSAVYTLTPPA